jgi:hypothetical protein
VKFGLAMCRQRRAPLIAGGVLLVLGLATVAPAQEAVRQSMASAAAAEARNRAATSMDNYNLKLGPTAWRFSPGLGFEYNDNVEYTEDNPKSDFIVRPQLYTSLLWPVSEKNSITLDVGAGYSAYTVHPNLSRSFVSPDSELAFNLYISDFWINLHERLSITEATYQDPTVSGTAGYSQLHNTLGVTTQWDLNKAMLRLNYDHENYSTLGGSQTQSQPDGQSEVVSLAAGYAPKPEMMVGVEVGGALLHYTGGNISYSDATEWNAGVFYNDQLSEHVRLQSSAGYTVFSPDSTGTTASDFNGMYGQIALTHQISRHVDYSLNGSRSISTALQGNTIDTYNATLQINWRIIRKTSLATSFTYYHGSDLQYQYQSETFDQFGPQITLGRALTDKLSSSLGYRYYWRDSNEANRSYAVNIVSLNFTYRL